MPPCPDFLLLFLATASIGAIWVGLNPKYSRRELAHPVADAAPKLIIYQREIDGRPFDTDIAYACIESGRSVDTLRLDGCILEDAGPQWQAFMERGVFVSAGNLQMRRRATEHTDPCLIVYTSGTTGAPKGALLTHAGLVYCSHTDARYNLYRKGQRILCNFPINHIACVGDVCMTTLVAGGSIHFMPQFDPEGILACIERERITHLGQIPVMHQAILAHPKLKDYDLSSLRQILWGGNPASLDLVRRLRALAPTVCNVYGMTETTGNVLFVRDQACDDETFANTVGWPPEEYDVVLMSEGGAQTPLGEVGEICVRGPFLMKGYWDNPDATADAFYRGGWLRTGDLARQREDGAFMITGRRSEMYKSGGYNVYPAEVEQALERMEGVAVAVVVGVSDPVYSEVGHAFLVCDGEDIPEAELPETDLREADLKEQCRYVLANYKIPKRFHFMRELPMLPNGKVDKAALKAEAAKAAA